MPFLNSFTRSLKPNDVSLSQDAYRFIVFASFGSIAAAVIHGIVLFLFAYIEAWTLAYFNIISVSMYLAIPIFLKRTGMVKLTYSIINIEIVAHAYLSSIYLGWEPGLHYWILLMPVVVFFSTFTLVNKFLIAAVNCFVYVFLITLTINSDPLIKLPSEYVHGFKYFNSASICIFLSYLAFHYHRAVKLAENRLEAEHEIANSALRDRNLALTKLDKEISEAADYVKAMLPDPIKSSSIKTYWKYVPSSTLGGDAFGYHWLDDNHFSIYLLDVSGHGVGPALLSVSILNVIRSNVISLSEFYRPDRFLGILNEMFDSDQHNDMFFTMWYGVYDKCEKVLSYSSAGHPPALLMNGSSIKSNSVVMLKTDNKIIAGLPGVSYSMANIEIISPAVLYVFSDGVYEHQMDRGLMWRFGDFVNFMGQSNPKQKSRVDLLYDHVSKVNQDKAFDDDFTIIEIRFL